MHDISRIPATTLALTGIRSKYRRFWLSGWISRWRRFCCWRGSGTGGMWWERWFWERRSMPRLGRPDTDPTHCIIWDTGLKLRFWFSNCSGLRLPHQLPPPPIVIPTFDIIKNTVARIISRLIKCSPWIHSTFSANESSLQWHYRSSNLLRSRFHADYAASVAPDNLLNSTGLHGPCER